jgi:N-acetylglucosaminyl-diphospho-decaprenol L-rhamnosyltransferase
MFDLNHPTVTSSPVTQSDVTQSDVTQSDVTQSDVTQSDQANWAESNRPHPESASSRTRIRVVILNYRTADLTVACLQSLVPEIESFPEFHVVVVDNQSNDGSVEKLAQAIDQHQWSEWVTLMPLDHNGGYASGNNAAVRPALGLDQPPQYFHILNPDTVVQPGALKALVDFMDQHPEAGIAGSRLQDPDGTPQCSAFRFPNLLGEIEGGLRLGPVSKLLAPWRVVQPIPDAVSQTDWVAGASMIVRREVFETAGLMDDAYFLYYEEVDFCLAAQRAGWSCWYVPDSRVVHYVGSSTGVSDTKQARKRLPTYWFDSRRRYFVKNYGRWYAALSEVALASSFAAWRVRRAIQQKPDLDPPHFLADFLRNSTLVKGGNL